MTEDDARDWIGQTFDLSSGMWVKLEQLVGLLIDENSRQNLIAQKSVEQIWARHIADSAQLMLWAPEDGLWVDVGAGAGLPGLVIAILRKQPILLVEPRRKRAEFLEAAAAAIGLTHVRIAQRDIRKVDAGAAIISARAVAELSMLFDMTLHLAHEKTRWVLPKGRAVEDELANARDAWHGVFHVEQSVTEPESRIIIASGIARNTT